MNSTPRARLQTTNTRSRLHCLRIRSSQPDAARSPMPQTNAAPYQPYRKRFPVLAMPSRTSSPCQSPRTATASAQAARRRSPGVRSCNFLSFALIFHLGRSVFPVHQLLYLQLQLLLLLLVQRHFLDQLLLLTLNLRQMDGHAEHLCHEQENGE